MARHLSVEKRHRQSLVRNRRNRRVKSRIRTAQKQFEAAGEAETKVQAMRRASAVVDKAAAKGVIHRNKAARMKSRMARQLKKESGNSAQS